MEEVRYSIKDFENFTKIKAHTIRIWEQRYGLLEPKRTSTNIRYYEDEDLKKILNIKLLYENGFKISKIAKLSQAEFIQQVKQVIEQEEIEFNSTIDDIILNITSFHEENIRKTLCDFRDSIGMEKLYTDIIIPVFVKIGKLWQVNTIDVCHEHFFSNIYKFFIISSLESLPLNTTASKKAVLFLHDFEEHEFSLLMNAYILRKSGVKTYYFGQKSPLEDLEVIIGRIEPDFVLSSFIRVLSEKEFEELVAQIESISGKHKVIINGEQAYRYKSQVPVGFELIQSVQDLKTIIGN